MAGTTCNNYPSFFNLENHILERELPSLLALIICLSLKTQDCSSHEKSPPPLSKYKMTSFPVKRFIIKMSCLQFENN